MGYIGVVVSCLLHCLWIQFGLTYASLMVCYGTQGQWGTWGALGYIGAIVSEGGAVGYIGVVVSCMLACLWIQLGLSYGMFQVGQSTTPQIKGVQSKIV